MDRIEHTGLWKRTLDPQHDGYEVKREELRSSFINFRDKAAHLVSKISGALPGLTQHDISHLDALWEVADLICGDEYPVNPLEAYVFGGAVLLHDSALCFEAYDNGIDGVRETTVWKDSFASLPDDNEEAKKIADFSALRYLHASQAEKLTEMSWSDPGTGQLIYLIENSTLRKHLGKLIGQIAASHHWSIEEVDSKLPQQVNVLPGFPREWRIDPIKIACMVRCADAAHIDNERAPDFLHALIKRRGISFDHWQAQNKLASVDIDQSDDSGSTLLFTSTQKFLENESESWWVAYDTACMIDKELRSSNALLESKQIRTPQFKTKRVKGIESPELMSNYIQTEGWNPCMAEVHVGNIESLVNALGGEKLYGSGCDKFEVITRELIQNARDSIHARREVEHDFVGEICIHVKSASDGCWLYIEDDGVGMSKRVLTGPLLDFGTSFWTSSLVQSEFPGLRSSKFKAVGQFGIGFYSVFMAADKVTVSSKPWNGGTSDVWQLNFNNGLSLRPLLKNELPNDFRASVSTQVKLHLKLDPFVEGDLVEVKRNLAKTNNLRVSIKNYLSAICAALDVPVKLKINEQDYLRIHSDIRKEKNHFDWLKKISFADSQSQEVMKLVESSSARLRPIVDNGIWHGLAAISIAPDNQQNFLSMRTVGHLASSLHGRSSDDFIGYIDYLPQSAKREGQIYSASESAIRVWANEQVEILKEKGLSDVDRCYLAYSLCHFGVDPIDIGYVIVNKNGELEVYSFEQLAEMSLHQEIAFLKSDYDHIETHTRIQFLEGKVTIKPLRNSEFLSLRLNDGVPDNENTILGCLFRAIEKLGRTPKIRVEKDVGESFFGRSDALIITSEV
ncbi:ATP-binding protein [Vibrio harveyi]|uniref:ATP-binding protein n=1 Tax=Vibrio harveyi TaxID=669 RepID=A0ABM5Y1H0_VIBHA|nr:ATP-binding protein [Vibrio harveyi]